MMRRFCAISNINFVNGNCRSLLKTNSKIISIVYRVYTHTPWNLRIFSYKTSGPLIVAHERTTASDLRVYKIRRLHGVCRVNRMCVQQSTIITLSYVLFIN